MTQLEGRIEEIYADAYFINEPGTYFGTGLISGENLANYAREMLFSPRNRVIISHFGDIVEVYYDKSHNSPAGSYMVHGTFKSLVNDEIEDIIDAHPGLFLDAGEEDNLRAIVNDLQDSGRITETFGEETGEETIWQKAKNFAGQLFRN